MARICQKWFPETDGFFMDEALKDNIDILLQNFADDWDFTVVISGEGEVRIGKSVLGMQIACYIAYMMDETYGHKTIFNLDNCFVFNGNELIKKGHYLGQNYRYSPLIYDEAGADLQSARILSQKTQMVLDYFRECGQYNLFNLLILPDFFDLPRGIATGRSIFLLDVYYRTTPDGKFERGYFKFFSKLGKRYLYNRGKKERDYTVQRADFVGEFFKFYPIDEAKYRKLKQEALKSRDKKEEKIDKRTAQRNALFYFLSRNLKYTYKQITDIIESIIGYVVPETTISDAILTIDVGQDVKQQKYPSAEAYTYNKKTNLTKQNYRLKQNIKLKLPPINNINI